MKFLVLILGSTTLVAGGTAITSQQDSRNNVIANQRPYQEHRAASRGTDCQPVENPIFGNVAYPLEVAEGSCPLRWSTGESLLPDADIDGNGVIDISSATYWQDDFGTSSFPSSIISFNLNTTPPQIISESVLILNPETINYTGLDIINYPFGVSILNLGYIDVTADGKPDALIEVGMQVDESDWDFSDKYYFYIENISEWTAACATDINNDGSTNVNDLLAVVDGWGVCP